MKRWFTLSALFLVASVVTGGDLATFQNLGFSPSGDVFAFGQYGVTGESSSPFAEIYVVDVAGNRFLAGGTFELRSEAPLPLGQDGRGALFALLSEAHALISRERVDHLQTGRPIYILVDGETPPERLSFRDFVAGVRYDVRLEQRNRPAGDSVEAAFSIDLTLIREDATQTVTIGLPSFFRENVESYQITQIIAGPENGAVVFVVEMRSPDGSIRYMVETASVTAP